VPVYTLDWSGWRDLLRASCPPPLRAVVAPRAPTFKFAPGEFVNPDGFPSAPSHLQIRRFKLGESDAFADDWSGWRDLNPRPTAPKAVALPGCATPRHIKILHHTSGFIAAEGRYSTPSPGERFRRRRRSAPGDTLYRATRLRYTPTVQPGNVTEPGPPRQRRSVDNNRTQKDNALPSDPARRVRKKL
jgi:hypothetical protein